MVLLCSPVATAAADRPNVVLMLAEQVSEVGYATGLFGKWHLGHTEGRFPAITAGTDRGVVRTSPPKRAGWVRWPMAEIMSAHLESLREEPPTKPGTLDPYLPGE